MEVLKFIIEIQRAKTNQGEEQIWRTYWQNINSYQIYGESMAFSIVLGQWNTHMGKNKSQAILKNNSRWIVVVQVKGKSIKLLDENI